MKTVFYKIECLTNLHVGSGEINYNIIDNEVEKDPVTGLPIIHASGVKGAIREALSEIYPIEEINTIFGTAGSGASSNGGTHKFLDACMIQRPMRVSGSDETSSIGVLSLDSINNFLSTINAFGANSLGVDKVTKPDFGNFQFLTNSRESLTVENEPTGKLDGECAELLSKLEGVIGDRYALVKSFEDFALPVMARNCLVENRGNLWYEEIVPHGSIFWFGVIYPDSGCDELRFPPVVRFGGNASIGCGYTKITKICEEVCNE